MYHSYFLEGFAFRLRPVRNEDAEFIRDLRCDPKLNEFLNPTSNDLQSQLDWLQSYYARPNDYYFVIERTDNGRREGLISLYNIETDRVRQGEWGRWILRPGSLAAVESAALIYKFGFEILQLDYIHCVTVAVNKRVVSFHDSCGIQERRILKNYFIVGSNKAFDGVEHKLHKSFWPEISSRLRELGRLVAARKNHFDVKKI